MQEKLICKGLESVLSEAQKMGINEVESFRHVPVKNVETVVNALKKRIPMTAVKGKLSQECPACGCGVRWRFCENCGQALKYSREEQ